jgi:hypothetical protein
MLTKKAIVFASVYFNSKIKVGSHHYAEALKKEGYEVLYISYPISILHYIFFFKKENINRIFKRYSYSKKEQINSFIPFSLIPLFNIFPLNTILVLKNWIYISDLFFNSKVKSFFQGTDLIWVESAFYLNAIKSIKKNNTKTRIFSRLSDNVSAFDNFPHNYLYLLNDAFSISCKIIISAHTLKKTINPLFKDKIIHIPNGINTAKLSAYSKEMPIEYINDTNTIKIVYIGAIENWFDWDIVRHIANNFPNISIYIIGPCNHLNIDINYSNLFILGPRQHTDIGKYLYNANIGIIPFKRNELIDCVDPIKYYEYSFFNLPTVCSYWEEVSYFKDPIFLANNKYEFATNIQYLIDNNFLINNLNIDLNQRDWYKNLTKIL